MTKTRPTAQAKTEVATLAGGCSGRAGVDSQAPRGRIKHGGVHRRTTVNPRYEDVHTGRTGHSEAVQIVFDPRQISYESILRTFSDCTIRPRSIGKATHGLAYRSAIFWNSDEHDVRPSV